jgi:hypothetical protein
MTRAPATSCRRTLAAAGAQPPRRPRAGRLATGLVAAATLATALAACTASSSQVTRGSVFETRQHISRPQVEQAIATLYRSHPGISAFSAQGIQYTAQSRSTVLRKCISGEAGTETPTVESSQVTACAPLIFFVYSYGQKASVPAAVDTAGKLYWYAVAHITGQAGARVSLDELLHSWNLPVPGLPPAEALSAAEASVVTTASNSILAQKSVHVVIAGQKAGSAGVAQRIVADIGTETGTESIRSGTATAAIRVTRTDAYFTGTPTGLRTFIGLTPAAARKAGSRWVDIKKGTNEYKDLAAEDTMAALPASILPATGNAAQLSTTTIYGRKVYVLDWKTAPSGSGGQVSERLVLAATTQALPISETTTANGDSQAVTLDHWGESITVRAPASAIPYSRVES